MSVFPEDDKAKIQIKEIQLEAMEKKFKEIDPLHSLLTLEIDLLKKEIEKDKQKIGK